MEMKTQRTKHRYLVVDGMLNGTGIRDEYEGGYLQPDTLGLSVELQSRLNEWLRKYEDLHYEGFGNNTTIEELDSEGIVIAGLIAKELEGTKISYYSDAKSTKRQIS
jgi:hypothetical protein